MPDNADTVVLFEELAVEDLLPVLWQATSAAPDPSLGEHNLQVLQAWDALEDHGLVDLPDDISPLAAELQRLDLKLTLLLELVGQILSANRPSPTSVLVRFNALGAHWRSREAPLRQPATTGVVEIHVHRCVAQPLRFPGTASVTDGEVNVRFLPLDDTVASLLGKIAFRRHRRQVAGRTNPQRPR